MAAASSPDLPLRVRPWRTWTSPRSADDRVVRAAEAAAERLSQLPAPEGPTVFIHGDLWQGNTVWDGERCAGMVDWDVAGVGDPASTSGPYGSTRRSCLDRPPPASS